MSAGQPGTNSNPSSGLSDKDQWLQDVLGVKMASFGSSAVTASPGPQGQQAKSQAKVDIGEPTVKPHRTRITTITTATMT